VVARLTGPQGCRNEGGFTLIELMVGVFLLAGGLLALVGTLDGSREAVSQSELKEAAAHRAQREMERVRALDFDEVALSEEPSPDSGADDPRSGLSGPAGDRSFAWNKQASSTEKLVVDAAKGRVAAGPTAWSDGRLSGQVWRFVSKSEDPTCSGQTPLCLQTSNFYKRVTIVVSITGSQASLKPTWISSFASNPDDAPTDGLSDPYTECLDSNGDLVECTSSLDDVVESWFLHDTPATESSRQAITGDHATHPTVAPFGVCTAVLQVGCPVPDLLGEEAPPSPEPLPELFKYSSDVTGGYAGGRVLRRDTTCSGTPSTNDNTKGAFWATGPLSAAKALNGSGGLSLHTQTVERVDADVTLCMAFYDVPGSLLNLVSAPPTEIGRASYSPASWPRTPGPVAFPFDFKPSGTVNVAAGHRIGVRIWVSSGSGADIAAIYDHPTYPSYMQLNEPGS